MSEHTLLRDTVQNVMFPKLGHAAPVHLTEQPHSEHYSISGGRKVSVGWMVRAEGHL